MNRVVLFCRVSSTNDRQSYERQIKDLTLLAETMNSEIVSVFAEKVSGAKKNHERPQLMKMVEFVNSNHIDKV